MSINLKEETSYKRKIYYGGGEKPSEFTEKADSLGAALDREVKFIMNQTRLNRTLTAIHIEEND